MNQIADNLTKSSKLIFTPQDKGEEFEEKFPHKIAEVADDFGSTVKSDLKDFIRKVEAQAYERGKADAYQIPMGVSQWREYGKKYFYWEFWVEQIRNLNVK